MTTYTAHITTAPDLGAPEVTVMTADDGTGASPLVSYPLTGDPMTTLQDHGWAVVGDVTEVGDGYLMATVQAVDVTTVVAHVTQEKARAAAEMERQDTAWRTLVHDAMHDGASATRLAQAAGVSRERVYQLRDGRR